MEKIKVLKALFEEKSIYPNDLIKQCYIQLVTFVLILLLKDINGKIFCANIVILKS
jgi:hypothetical protein